MTARPPEPRRRDSEATRRRVLDAVVEAVGDVGYYKASSNEIARRAGVTWGAIQHLFGSREQLMLEVVLDFGARLRSQLTEGTIEGDSLEARLHSLLDALALYYEEPAFLVQVQILLDLSVNPRTSATTRRAIRETTGDEVHGAATALLDRALGSATPPDLVELVYVALRGYLIERAISGVISDLTTDPTTRQLLVAAVATTVRDERTRRGLPAE